MNKEILDYIEESYGLYTSAAIRERLLRVGYSEMEIDLAFQEFLRNKGNIPPKFSGKNKSPALYLIVIVGVIILSIGCLMGTCPSLFR